MKCISDTRTTHKQTRNTMIRIIEGLRYDTKTATEIASWDNGLSGRDFYNANETLYKTDSGRFFIHGCGGPASEWRDGSERNGYNGGEDLKVLSKEEAIKWFEKTNQDTNDPDLNALIKKA